MSLSKRPRTQGHPSFPLSRATGYGISPGRAGCPHPSGPYLQVAEAKFQASTAKKSGPPFLHTTRRQRLTPESFGQENYILGLCPSLLGGWRFHAGRGSWKDQRLLPTQLHTQQAEVSLMLGEMSHFLHPQLHRVAQQVCPRSRGMPWPQRALQFPPGERIRLEGLFGTGVESVKANGVVRSIGDFGPKRLGRGQSFV